MRHTREYCRIFIAPIYIKEETTNAITKIIVIVHIYTIGSNSSCGGTQLESHTVERAFA